MKNLFRPFALAFTLLSLTTSLLAQSLKVITLKDGTILRGQVVAFQDGIYTLDTSVVGQVQVADADILSIASEEAADVAFSGSEPGAQAGIPQDNDQLKAQVQQLQGSVLSDPDLMQDIQGLVESEDIKAILSDPNFVNDVLSYDPQKIDQNEKTQELLQNPQMQELMKKIKTKLPAAR